MRRVSGRALPVAAALLLAALPILAPGVRGGEDPEPPRYAGAPEDLVPWKGATAPLRTWFEEPMPFRGAGRDREAAVVPETVRLGVLLPLAGPDGDIGRSALDGMRLALEEANGRGGFEDRPFELVVREDVPAWGASSNRLVELACDEQVWGVLGAVDGSSTHVMLRVALKLEIPIVATADTDPTLTETRIPWLVRVVPDDRQACYRLVEEVLRRRGHERVAILRTNERYGRVGVGEFTDAARRLGHPVVADLRFGHGGVVGEGVLARLRQVRADALLLWGSGEEMGRAARAVREAGLDLPLYGPDRMLDPAFVHAAGAAAEGATAVRPWGADAAGPLGKAFVARFRKRFDREPDHHAAFGFDGAVLLMDAVRAAGLNRARIRDALHATRSGEGVTGTLRFDPTFNNLGHVEIVVCSGGRFRVPPR